MDISTYLTYLRGTAANPLTYKDVSGMPTEEAHEYIFSQNYVLTNDVNMLRSFLTKTISIVTYRTKGGKYQPVGQESINFETLDPIDLKLTCSFIADEIEKYIQLMSSNIVEQRNYGVSGLAGVYRSKLEDMLMTKQKMLISQENELLATGRISFPFKEIDGLIKSYQIDFTGIDGAIASKAYTDSGYINFGTATKQSEIAKVIEKLRLLGFTNSNGALFKKTAPLVIFAGTNCYTDIVGKYSDTALPEKSVLFTDDNVNFYLKLNGQRIPIIESVLYREYFANAAATTLATYTQTAQLGVEEMLLVDNTKGNFGFADLRFVNMNNLNGSSAARAYNVEFEAMRPASEGVDMFFSSRTMAFGRTKAIIKYTASV
jgi:hypothetical protein